MSRTPVPQRFCCGDISAYGNAPTLGSMWCRTAIQGSRTQTIMELENLLGELRHIEEEESQLLELASDRQAQVRHHASCRRTGFHSACFRHKLHAGVQFHSALMTAA